MLNKKHTQPNRAVWTGPGSYAHGSKRGLLCRWPSITEWEMHITAQGPPSPKWPILCRVWC